MTRGQYLKYRKNNSYNNQFFWEIYLDSEKKPMNRNDFEVALQVNLQLKMKTIHELCQYLIDIYDRKFELKTLKWKDNIWIM